MASAAQTSDALVESGFSNAVVNGIYSLSVRGLFDHFCEVFFGV